MIDSAMAQDSRSTAVSRCPPRHGRIAPPAAWSALAPKSAEAELVHAAEGFGTPSTLVREPRVPTRGQGAQQHQADHRPDAAEPDLHRAGRLPLALIHGGRDAV